MSLAILTVGIILIVYYIVLTAVMGSIVFSKVVLLVGVLFVIYWIVDKLLDGKSVYVMVKRVLAPIVVFCGVVFTISELVIAGFGLIRNTDEADYLIILGAGLRGETMTMTLRQRMEDAYGYVSEYGGEVCIVVSGGQGQGEDIAESEAMMRYLLEMGIEDDRILKEDQSTSTYENLLFSKAIIEEHSGRSIKELRVKIATSGFHSLRSYMLAKSCGYGDVTSYGCRINPIFIPVYYLREFAAMTKTFIIDPLLGLF